MDKLRLRFMQMVLRMLFLLVRDHPEMNSKFSADYVKLTMDIAQELNKDKVYND